MFESFLVVFISWGKTLQLLRKMKLNNLDNYCGLFVKCQEIIVFGFGLCFFFF